MHFRGKMMHLTESIDMKDGKALTILTLVKDLSLLRYIFGSPEEASQKSKEKVLYKVL